MRIVFILYLQYRWDSVIDNDLKNYYEKALREYNKKSKSFNEVSEDKILYTELLVRVISLKV